MIDTDCLILARLIDELWVWAAPGEPAELWRQEYMPRILTWIAHHRRPLFKSNEMWKNTAVEIENELANWRKWDFTGKDSLEMTCRRIFGLLIKALRAEMH